MARGPTTQGIRGLKKPLENLRASPFTRSLAFFPRDSRAFHRQSEVPRFTATSPRTQLLAEVGTLIMDKPNSSS